MASSLTYWVVLNTEFRKPEALALPFEHFEVYPKNVPTEKSFAKINLHLESRFLKNKTVLLSDLDIVNHANNVKYLEWCLDCIHPKKILNNGINAFDMNFLKELQWHDEVELVSSMEEIPNFISVMKNDKYCFALLLDYNP
jgi:acyl-ACP thioesterase